MSLACEAVDHGIICERDLPPCVREALHAARLARPYSALTCVAFRTLSGGHEITHLEPDARLDPARVSSIFQHLRKKDVLVLSVTIAETTFETVDIVTHVLVALACARGSCS